MSKFYLKYKEKIERFRDDFDYFCNYLIQNKIKLSSETGFIGRKACYAINQKMYRREE